MSLIPFVGAAQKFNKSPDQYRIERSLRFRSSASAFLNRTPSTASNRTTWTWSGWVKLGVLGTHRTLFDASNTDENNDFWFQISSGNALAIQQTVGGTVSGQISVSTTAIFRDPSAWYHIVLSMDTGNATSTNRARFYVNGVQQTAFSSYTVNSVNTWVNNNSAHTIGKQAPPNSGFLDGYLTEINFVDGQALTPSSFGEFNTKTGVWQPKKYNGTYGTNGFYLNFSDNSSLSNLTADKSGNNNNWTPNNISLISGATFDSMIDVPTPYADGGNGRGNYAVMNPIRTSSAILTNGNLQVAQNTTAYVSSSSTMGMSSGKWYWEVTIVSASSQVLSLGITNSTSVNGITSGIWTYHLDGTKYIGASNSAYGSNYNTNGVVVGFAFDADAGTLTCYRNNVSQGTLVSGLAADTYFAYATLYNSGTVAFNFGQRPFAYTPPTGFKALNTQNLPEPVIAKGGEYFNTVLYTGNGSTNNITGVGFQPDFVWLKARSAGGFDHVLQDVIRGSTRQLYTNTTDAEVDDTDAVTSFNSDGFTSGADVTTNNSGTTFVAWNWKANGAGVTNTAGSITSTVSANPTAGFSIVTYTGGGANSTMGHGLGVTPALIFCKSRSASGSWSVNGNVGGLIYGTNKLLLESTAGLTGDTNEITAANSSTFTGGGSNATSGSGITYVAYCFSEVAGYSRFGSYTGNGSADGPFVFCGFRPAFVMIKRTDVANDWALHDKSRIGYNVANYHLLANSSSAEFTDIPIDLLSNGFKLRGASGTENASGGTYIFMAFAESPFRNALAR
jgi:hypothetical protein